MYHDVPPVDIKPSVMDYFTESCQSNPLASAQLAGGSLERQDFEERKPRGPTLLAANLAQNLNIGRTKTALVLKKRRSLNHPALGPFAR